MEFGTMAIATAASVLGFGIVVNGVQDAMPTEKLLASDYFEVHSVDICRDVDGLVFTVERTIHQPVSISASVRVMTPNGAGWTEFAETTRPFRVYSPNAALPDEIDLDWWTWGDIPDATLPAGDLAVWTDWDFELDGLDTIYSHAVVRNTCEVTK